MNISAPRTGRHVVRYLDLLERWATTEERLRELERDDEILDEAARWTNGAGPEDPAPKVEAIRRALIEDAEDTRSAEGPARVELPGTSGLAHRGVAAEVFGDRGEGKSMMALVVGWSAAAAGARVLYLDRENGGALTRERLEGIADAHEEWGDPLSDGRFVGRHYPRLNLDWDPDDFGDAVAGLGFTFVIYDSLRAMMAVLGLDPNSDADFSKFHELAIVPLTRRAVGVWVQDNVGHENKNRPKGAGAKLDALPQAYKVTSTRPRFSMTFTSSVEIECTRSRYGDEGRKWRMQVGGDVFEAPEATSEPPDVVAARKAGQKREAFRRACVAAVEKQAPLARDDLIEAARENGAKGRNDKLRRWLSELADEAGSGLMQTEAGHVPEGWPQ
jgi:hypothetical protein